MSGSDPALDLSVAIVACDAERTIERTLQSVRGLALRVIVVDSGSRDRTRQMCEERGAEVIEHEWEGYVGQKQFALELCDTAWVLNLDSDEALDPELADAVRQALAEGDAQVAGYEMNRRVWFGDLELRPTWQPEWRTRLVRRARARFAGRDPHDRLQVDGAVRRLPGCIRHDSFATVTEFVRKQIAHGLRAGESYHEMNRKGSAFKLAVSPPAAVLKQLVLRMAWRDGWAGWVCSFGAGIQAAAKHMRLLELSRRP